MGRICHICAHPNREEIDRELAAGGSPTRIARRYRASKDSMRRHATNHLGDLLGLALKGEYQGDVSGVQSMTITTRFPSKEGNKC